MSNIRTVHAIARAPRKARIPPPPASDAADGPVDVERMRLCLRHLFLPWRVVRGVLVVATADMSAPNIARIHGLFGPATHVIPVETQVLIERIQKEFSAELLDSAVNELARCEPHFSARIVITQAQVWSFAGLAAAAAVALVLAAPAATAVLVALSAFGYCGNALFRLALVWMGASERVWEGGPPAVADDDLPSYTVIVPLFHEANVLPHLVGALRDLDYPRDRLQVLLVLETDDADTVAAVQAAALPKSFEWVRVPEGQPRTKPRACNFALQFARGEYVVIFDAEDRPEPDQLRKAAAAFRAAPPAIACFQARLNFYNAGHNWITRLFALDYALWFDYLLPGLERIRVPMPLGGTSNHFRTAALNAIHGWDPYNVTEDADIGIRLWRMGHRVRTLNSTTFEEAPSTFRAWLGQRSRWLKGYMQTWLVHMRNPRRLLRNAGPAGFLGFQLFVGGTFAAALFNPILWMLFLASLAAGAATGGNPLPEFTAKLSLGGLLIGNVLVSYLMMLGPVRRGWFELTAYGLAAPVYWALISIAGYRALFGLVVRPWHWHKTPHGLSPSVRGVAA